MKQKHLLLAGAAGLALVLGCGADKPLPENPYPEDPPLEETDLAPFLEVPAGSGGDAAEGGAEGAGESD